MKLRAKLKAALRPLARRYRTSVSMKLLSAVLIVSSTLTVFTTAAQLVFNYRDEIRDLNEGLEFVEKGYSGEIAQALWEMNDLQVRAALNGIQNLSGVKYIEISDGPKTLFSIGKPPSGQTISRTFSLEYKNSSETIKLGQLKVTAGLDHIYAKIRKTLLFLFLTQFLKTMIVSFLVLLIIRQILVRHLISITDYLRRLDISNEIPKLALQRESRQGHDGDELDILVNAINRMRTNLQLSYLKLSNFNQELELSVDERTRQLQESQRIIVEQQNALVASAKMSALGEMAGGIAHEINNPLATLQGLAYLMNKLISPDQWNDQGNDQWNGKSQNELNNEQKAELKKLLTSMTQLTERIAKIIQGLRTFSRDGSRDPLETVFINTLIDETLSFCLERFKAHNVLLSIDPIAKDLALQGRGTQLSQVLLNLLNNAFDAVHKRDEKWVRISVREKNSSIELRVTDSGPGIPKDLRNKLFQPFFTTKEPGKGTGLGLSISFGILRAHRGELTLDETSPHTSFVLRIPKQQVPAQETIPTV